ncbi:MAG: alpha/beta hydrolase [Planctomycetota bacterium]
MNRPIIRRIAATTLATYLAVVLLMTFIESWLVYPAPPLGRSDWAPAGIDFEDVWFDSEDGTRLHGWFFDRPESRRSVLYFHGNGEQVADNGELMQMLAAEFDAAVLIFDYRGYGKSAGRPHERGLVADGRAAQRWLAERTGRTAGDVVLIGRSIGGGVAVACAAELGAGALVLQSTFSRLTDAAGVHYPWLPVRLLMRNRFDSVSRIAEYDGPLFVSHGGDDFVIPIEQGRRLYDVSPSEPKEFFEVRGGGHNDPQPRGYYQAVRAFLDSASQRSLARGG